MTIAFLVVRVVNGYGDRAPWSWQSHRGLHGAVVPEHDEVPAVAGSSC